MYSKYAFDDSLKDKKETTINNIFESVLGNSKIKPNRIWTDQGSEFYNTRFLRKWLKGNNAEMHSTYNKAKSY